MTPKKDEYMRGYGDAFKEAFAAAARIAEAAYEDAPSGSYDNGGTQDGWQMACQEIAKRIKSAFNGETGMVPVTGKERPMLRPEAASTEARFESASLHHIHPTA